MYVLIVMMLFLPTVYIIAITPYITRRTESFGISIPEEIFSSPELSQLRRQYRNGTIVLAFPLLLVSLLSRMLLDENKWMLLFFSLFVGFIIGSYAIYYQFHKRMKILKEEKRWDDAKVEKAIVDMKFRSKKIVVSYKWFFVSGMIAIITIVLTILQYDRLPNEIPMNYSMSGEVTKWAEKSIGSAFSLPFTQLFSIGLFMYLNFVIAKTRQQIEPSHPDVSIQQNIVFRRRWSIYLVVMANIMTLMFSVLQISIIYHIDHRALTIFPLFISGLIMIGTIILAVSTGQGGSKVGSIKAKEGEYINRNEDDCWKLGIFYFNPDDPALWVEKRFGVGWTMNMGRPIAWVSLFIILILIVIGFIV